MPAAPCHVQKTVFRFRTVLRFNRCCCVCIMALLCDLSVRADDWPQWHGQNRNPVSGETGLLKSWTDGLPALKWRAVELGDGYSSVVVSQGVVYTTGKIDGDVYCFAIQQKTGFRKWSTLIGTTSRNVMATPTVQGNLVYALDPDGELSCLSTSDGRVLWQRSFMEDFGGQLMSGRGYGESPLVDGDRLICTPGGKEAMIVALDRRSGEVIWKSGIPDIGEKGRDGAAFSSVGKLRAAGVQQYVQLVGRGLIGVEAETGRFLWGYNDISNSTANIPTPIVRNEYVFSANGYHAGSVLLKIEADKESKSGVTPREVYRLRGNRFQSHHGGFVVAGDYVFGGHGSNNGLPTCIEFLTGDIAWKSRGPGTGSASVCAADGHLYFHYQDGVIALIEASSDAYRLKGTFQLPNTGADSWSHPVVADGLLLLREQNELSAYDLRGNSPDRPHTEPKKIPAELASLVQLGATVEFVGESSKQSHWHRMAVGDDSIPRVKLSGRHLTPNGELNGDFLKALIPVKSPIILDASGTDMSETGIRQAASLESLEGLSLELCPRVDDAALQPLKNASRLRILNVSGTSIGTTGLEHISRLPKIVALNLEVCDNITDPSCEILAGMQTLRALVLKKTGFESARISAQGLQTLSALRNLEVLNLYGNSINDKGLQQLQGFRNLRDLDLSLTAISDAGLTHLTRLEKLTHLTLLYSEGFAGPKITDVGLKPLSELNELRNLNLVGARLTDAGVDDLLRLKKLTKLTLVGTQISADGMSRLGMALPACDVVSGQ